MKTTSHGAPEKEELNRAKLFAARAKKHGTRLDLAITQCLRERLWRQLLGEFNVKEVRALLPLLLASRRALLLEARQSEAEKLTVGEQEKLALQLFGDFASLPVPRELAESQQKSEDALAHTETEQTEQP